MQNNWEVYEQLISNCNFNSNPIFVNILLFSKPWPVTLDYDFFRSLRPMKSIDWIHTLLSLLLVLVLHWGQRSQHRRRDIRVILINTTKLCDPDRRWDTERHSVGLAVSESLTSDSTLTPVICRRQHLSGEKPTNIKHFTQQQTETRRTASRCISTIYFHSYNLCWRSFCASRLFLRHNHNSIRYNSICLNKMFYHQNSEQHESSHLGKMLRNWRHEQGAEDFQSQPNQWLLECCDLQCDLQLMAI